MNRILMTIAVAGLVLGGCAQVENERYDVPNSNLIGFSASTSRASVNDLDALKGSGTGFKVYGTTADKDNVWYENVEGKNYVYDTAWKWADADAVWPASDASYPMNFYAIYPSVTLTTANAVDKLSQNVTIAPTAAEQVDMLSAKNSAATKPASGQISLNFLHILSKVDFGVIAGHDKKALVQSVAIKNVHRSSSYDYIEQQWSGTTTAVTGYIYYADVAAPFNITGDTNEDDVDLIYTGTHDKHLMLMPQSATPDTGTGAPAAWDKTAGNIATGAYIEVVYRIEDVSTDPSSDYIGFAKGVDYLDIYGAEGITPWEDYTGLGEGDGLYSGALFVKAGFPLTLNWEPGKGYTYSICLGTADSTNGYYLSEYYYDDAGDETGVPIIGKDNKPITPGDPVTDGIITFLVTVEPWVDSSPVLQ